MRVGDPEAAESPYVEPTDEGIVSRRIRRVRRRVCQARPTPAQLVAPARMLGKLCAAASVATCTIVQDWAETPVSFWHHVRHQPDMTGALARSTSRSGSQQWAHASQDQEDEHMPSGDIPVSELVARSDISSGSNSRPILLAEYPMGGNATSAICAARGGQVQQIPAAMAPNGKAATICKCKVGGVADLFFVILLGMTANMLYVYAQFAGNPERYPFAAMMTGVCNTSFLLTLVTVVFTRRMLRMCYSYIEVACNIMQLISVAMFMLYGSASCSRMDRLMAGL
eukprot:gnl/TRDRNA2_/TRDRNA2_125643_c0_seq1.p1 gnl/TRDRNA2_/TRDRNA2_125643_c0~~gnl/TRDRNA2_/TRDRNA2_125643_c0_seq1.p1  ORF type:complete len:283 (-),score=35.34 gnl/TRDRNA2_/TRDRNA2_125643_c0_seq1:90-938(-)